MFLPKARQTKKPESDEIFRAPHLGAKYAYRAPNSRAAILGVSHESLRAARLS